MENIVGTCRKCQDFEWKIHDIIVKRGIGPSIDEIVGTSLVASGISREEPTLIFFVGFSQEKTSDTILNVVPA